MTPRHVLPLALVLAACVGTSETVTVDTSALVTFGAQTAVPSDEVAERLDLPFNVRQQGRELTSVTGESTLARLGLKAGDVLLELDGVPLYSQDDVADVLRVHRPGDEVAIAFHPAGDPDVVETTIVLGDDAGPHAEGIEWQFASLANLERALERAADENKGVLVGLSGAET